MIFDLYLILFLSDVISVLTLDSLRVNAMTKVWKVMDLFTPILAIGWRKSLVMPDCLPDFFTCLAFFISYWSVPYVRSTELA